MPHLEFKLTGEYALWRHLGDPLGAYSCPGPSPSHLAGILGAAMGFPNATTQGSAKGNWPVSKQLLEWQQANDYHVACKLLTAAIRVPYRTNGVKGVLDWVTLRMNQYPVARPTYLVRISLNSDEELENLFGHLKKPIFSIFLGSTQFPGFIESPRLIQGSELDSNGWAFWYAEAIEDYSFCTKHDVTEDARIVVDGYWIYPDPREKKRNDCPLIQGYVGTPKAV
jgi:hypothetical protein